MGYIYEEINPAMWKPKEGESVEGELVNKQKDVSTNGSMLYTIETDKELINCWGSTVLDNRMQLVDIGDSVRITFVRTEKNKKGQPLKIYKVEKRKLSDCPD